MFQRVSALKERGSLAISGRGCLRFDICSWNCYRYFISGAVEVSFYFALITNRHRDAWGLRKRASKEHGRSISDEAIGGCNAGHQGPGLLLFNSRCTLYVYMTDSGTVVWPRLEGFL